MLFAVRTFMGVMPVVRAYHDVRINVAKQIFEIQ